ncbi:MAG: hypothetical protein ACTSW1_02860 [Candidatus Hodarchaeales archaeon]
MKSNNDDNLSLEQKESKGYSWVDYLLILILINLGLFIIVTLFASITVRGYMAQLLPVVFLTGVVLFADIVVTFMVSIVFSTTVKRIFKWSEERETNLLAGAFIVTITILVIGSISFIYLLVLPDFPLILDPFSLSNNSPTLKTIYSLWWFVGFVISTLILVILLYFV